MNMNTGDPNTRRDGEAPKAPAKLVAALKELPARRVFVPPAVDAAVLGAARQHFARTTSSAEAKGHFARVLRHRLLWPAVATTCVVFAALTYVASRSSPAFAREDLNHDGRVDILDAFQLARETQSGAKPKARADFNRDGQVDQRDAEFLAKHAVQLAKGGKS